MPSRVTIPVVLVASLGLASLAHSSLIKLDFELLGPGLCDEEGESAMAADANECLFRCTLAPDCRGVTYDVASKECTALTVAPVLSIPDPDLSEMCWTKKWTPGFLGGYTMELYGVGRCFTPDPFAYEFSLNPASQSQCAFACENVPACAAYTWDPVEPMCLLHADYPSSTVPGDGSCFRLREPEWREDWSDCGPGDEVSVNQYRCFLDDVRIKDAQCLRVLGDRPYPTTFDSRPCFCTVPEPPEGEILIDCMPGDELTPGEGCDITCEDGYHLTDGDTYWYECDETGQLIEPDRVCEPDYWWMDQPWGPCVDGEQTRSVYCIEVATGLVEDDALCTLEPRPEDNRPCSPESEEPTVTCCSPVGGCQEYPYLADHYCCGRAYTHVASECCHIGIEGHNEWGCALPPDSGGTCDMLCNPWFTG